MEELQIRGMRQSAEEALAKDHRDGEDDRDGKGWGKRDKESTNSDGKELQGGRAGVSMWQQGKEGPT